MLLLHISIVKVDAQIEEKCRRTISYLKGYSYPKLYYKKLSNQKPTTNTVSTTRKTTLCWMRAEIKERHFFISIDILNYISVWWSGRKKAEETKRQRGGLFPSHFPHSLPRCFCSCSLFFAPSPSSATRLWPQERRTPKLWLSYSQEQTVCTFCQILSLTAQQFSRSYNNSSDLVGLI